MNNVFMSSGFESQNHRQAEPDHAARGLRYIGVFAPGGTNFDRLPIRTLARRAMIDPTEPRSRLGPADHRLQLFIDAAQPNLAFSQRAQGEITIIDGVIYSIGDDPATETAEQLLSHHYEEEGDALFNKLNASASVTIADLVHNRLHVARDNMGGVPVYYMQQGDVFFWSSDLWGLAELSQACTIDPAALDFYLGNGYVASPFTLVKGIAKLPAGHLLCVDRNGVRIKPLWKMRDEPLLSPNGPETAHTEGFRDKFKEAVRKRLHPRDNVGVLLSGGVDSKFLLANAALHRPSGIQAFTFRYEQYEGQLNETPLARQAAVHLGVPHHEIPFGPVDLNERFFEIAGHFAEPLAYGLHSLRLDRIREYGVTDLLSGAGADGYFLNERNHLVRAIASVPVGILRLAQNLPELSQTLFDEYSGHPVLAGAESPGRMWRYALGAAIEKLPHHVSGMIALADQRRSLLLDKDIVDAAQERHRALFEEFLEASEPHSLTSRLKFIAFYFYGADAVQPWNHGLARRARMFIHTPYYDPDLVDYGFRLQWDSAEKRELRALAASLMPEDVAQAGKVSQALPLAQWLSGPLRDFVHDSLSETEIRRQGIFDPLGVQTLLERHSKGEPGLHWQIWTVLALSAWMQAMLKH